jgi:iron complex transport system ATP-binding protein
MLLEAQDLHFARGPRAILAGVSLGIAPGELVALIGPNGAGKSTLLHLLSGALRPDRGRVLLAGEELSAWPRSALARRRAVLPQSSELSFPFTGLEVVLMGRSAHAGSASRGRDLTVALQALDAVDARDLAERVFPTLSGGERQRVQLARVLAQIWPEGPETRLLLLDEPTNNLDLAHQTQLLRFARSLADQGVGVLAVLHDPNLAALHADRLAVLAEGTILQDGPVASVLTQTTIERAFGLPVAIRPHPLHGTPQLYAV